MVVIDKAREYLRSIADSEEHYNYLLNNVWVNPTFRNSQCQHPELSCGDCPLNFLKTRVHSIAD